MKDTQVPEVKLNIRNCVPKSAISFEGDPPVRFLSLYWVSPGSTVQIKKLWMREVKMMMIELISELWKSARLAGNQVGLRDSSLVYMSFPREIFLRTVERI